MGKHCNVKPETLRDVYRDTSSAGIKIMSCISAWCNQRSDMSSSSGNFVLVGQVWTLKSGLGLGKDAWNLLQFGSSVARALEYCCIRLRFADLAARDARQTGGGGRW